MNYGGASGSNPPWARQSGSDSNYSTFSTGSGYQSQQHINQASLALPTSISSGSSGSSYSSSRSTSQQSAGQAGVKQRVFAGTITKVSDNFGFVDDDVFFQTSVCKGGVPKMSDKVLVEATYNANMPFKWNATRIQLLPNPASMVPAQPQQAFQQAAAQQLNALQQAQLTATGISPLLNQGMNMPMHHMTGQQSHGRGGYNSNTSGGMGKPHSRLDNQSGGNRTSRFDQRDRRDNWRDRQRSPRRRSRSPPPRRRSRSPKARSRSRSPRRKQRAAPRYSVTISPLSFDTESCSVLAVKNRYSNMYIPSDFFYLSMDWVKAFPLHRPFPLGNSTRFHICPKDVTPLKPFPEVVDPPDADYSYSAKVMLLTQPSIDEIYKQCCSMSEESRDEDFTHPTRVLQFLVGMRSKNEPLAIGGPWSPSLDGEDPASNPQVLINTAIRTTRNLTGVDLSSCAQWYKFVDISYLRAEETYKGKVIPEHTEHVVIFLPDIWSVVPTMMDYLNLQDRYKHSLLVKLGEEEEAKQPEESSVNPPVDPPVSQATVGNSATETSQSQEATNEEADVSMQSDGADGEAIEKPEATHWSKLDPKTMKVLELRTELEARSVSCKGLKTQLQAKLSKLLKVEMEAEEEKDELEGAETTTPDAAEPEEVQEEERVEPVELTAEEKEKKAREQERLKAHLEKLYVFPEEPVIMVHPNRSAKNGKFDCSVMSLSVLLDYRPEDNKEHSFEVSLFAESFNEMLSRDFGFCIYKKLCTVASKPEEKAVEEIVTEKGDDSKASGDKEKASDEKDNGKEDKEGGKRQREQSLESESKRRKRDDDDDDKSSLSSSVTGRSDRAGSVAAKKLKKEQERRPQVTADRAALLAFVYYDTTHVGYIMDKDIEDMIYTLGLQVSRAQVRSMLQKICTGKDNVSYRNLTDRPEPQPDEPEEQPEKVLDIVQLAEGNRGKVGEAILPEQKEESNVVVYQGAVLELDKVLAKMDRSESSRLKVERDMRLVQEEREALKLKLGRSEERVKKLTSDLKRTSDKLSSTKSERNKREEEVSSLREVLSATSRELHRAINLVDSSLAAEVKEEPADRYTPSREAPSVSDAANGVSDERDDKQDVPLDDSMETSDATKEELLETETEAA